MGIQAIQKAGVDIPLIKERRCVQQGDAVCGWPSEKAHTRGVESS